MTAAATKIVQRVCVYCNMLRDDGLSYADYVEQLTSLLFLKMAHERTQPPFDQKPMIPREFTGPRWSRRTATSWRCSTATRWNRSAGSQGCSASSSTRRRTRSRTQRSSRWRVYPYEDLVARDKASLDIFWLKDESLADTANLPPPEVIADEMIEDLRAALDELEQLRAGLPAQDRG